MQSSRSRREVLTADGRSPTRTASSEYLGRDPRTRVKLADATVPKRGELRHV